MFCTQDAKLFVPHGRLCCHSHPGSSSTGDLSKSHIGLHNFKNISLTNQIQESWMVQKSSSSIENCDEELYSKDNLVVWSRSISGSSSQTLRTFTMDSLVIKALWCNFLMPADKPIMRGSDNTAFCQQSCVCVIEEGRMSFFSNEGQSHTSHIPMPVKNVWPIQNGLLFERNTMPDCHNSKRLKHTPNKGQKLTTVFSLIHPLDELVPVVYKSGLANQAPISFITDAQQEIVFTSESPSIAVTFHHENKKHSVWTVRWTTAEEVDYLAGRCGGDITGYASPNTSRAYEAHKMTPKPTNSSGTLSRHTFSPSTDASHLPSLSSKISSPSFGYSHLSSPNLGSRLTALNRTHSPSVKLPSPSRSFNSPSANNQSNLPSFLKAPLLDTPEPLAPEICLAHMWTEPIISREGEPATKVFFTSDFSGQQFLCFLVGTKQHIKFIKFEESNEKNFFIFGNTSIIPAKDAVPLSSLQLMVVLDLNNILFLYSGLYKMNVIHISGLMTSPRFNQSALDLGPTTSSRPASSMDINLDDVPISPVAMEMPADGQISLQCLPVINAFNICSLRDPVENRFTIELLEGELCRVEMPEISSSSLVSLCLLALKSCLPEHIVLALFSKWYIARNSPGLAGSIAEWTHFASFLFTSLGYNDAYQLLGLEEVCNMSPKLKKRRMSEEGTDSDWLDMLKSRDAKRFKSSYGANFDFFTSEKIESSGSDMKLSDARPDPKAFLYPYIFHVLFNIHLIYEEVKLDSVLQSNISDLAKLLCYLSEDLGLSFYSDQYCRDHPALFKFCNLRSPSNYFSDVRPPPYFSIRPPHIHEWIYLFLTNHNVSPFPILPGITFRTQQVILMFIMKFVKDKNDAVKYLKSINTSSDVSPMLPYFNEPDVDCSILLMALSENGMQSHLPPCLITPVIHAIHNCRKNPPKQWTEEAYKFIGREDLATQCRSEKTEGMGRKEEIKSFLNEDPSNKSEGDGMDRLDSELLKLRFSKDLRMKEIKKLLQSSVAIKVALQQKLGVSDHEFIDEQEKYLYAVSARTMALPIGRGMLTYGTYIAVPTEALPIPKLCLSGRVPPRNNIIEMTHIEIPSNLTEWPQFHNGVATGLRLMDTTKLDSTWILFNKLKSENMTNEHAGFLMGQGLTGHLSGLACLDVHDYLIKGNEMISIGLLLGMSADKRGTMDMTVTKTLSIHISALLPPSSAELDVHHNVQVASVFGIGLVYQSSAHRHLAEVLLSEIGRPPGPEMENSVDRESYSLAAGLALGNVMLAKGTELLDVSGSEMPDYLYYYMNGRKRKPMSNSYRERYKATSCQIKEGECVNTDVTAPGAIVALGLMFFNSGNTSIADWLVAPDTPSLLECMMPDLLMLRTVGYGLIMWKNVTPTDEWINKNIPEIVKECAFDKCQISENPDCNVDIELMSQAYVNIIAGGCMVIGLKFAGSANKEAFECLYRYFQQIFCWQKTASCIDYAGKYTLEQCLCLVVLCMAMVMAGTGDLTVLRICRHLRARIAQHVSYGSHMIIGMACGLLVLGGGKCTLSSKPEAVAAMLCAFFPKFPIHANDNRFHLQAFRHLYVLAIEKRMLIPCDVDTNKACYAELQLVYQNGIIENVTAPYMLPELDTLKEIKVYSPNYWHVEFKKTENWNSLKMILSGGGRLYVKQRTNLSLQSKYITEYPLEANEFLEKIFKHKGTTSTKDSYLMEFSKLFVRESEDDAFSEYTQLISKCLYNKISEMLPVQIDIYQNVAFSLKSASHPFLLWQFRILCAYYDRVEKSGREEFSSVSKEFLIAMQNSIESQLIKLLGDRDFKKSLCCYLLGKESNSSEDTINKLSSYLTWFNVPHPKFLFPNGLCLHSFSSLYNILKNKGFSVASAKVLSRSLADIQKT